MPAVQDDRLTPAHIAREFDKHPSAPVRWIQKGALLSTGERVRLKALSTPGGWRVRREDLDQFLEILTADRLRPSTSAEPKPIPKAAHLQKLHAELADAGF